MYRGDFMKTIEFENELKYAFSKQMLQYLLEQKQINKKQFEKADKLNAKQLNIITKDIL